MDCHRHPSDSTLSDSNNNKIYGSIVSEEVLNFPYNYTESLLTEYLRFLFQLEKYYFLIKKLNFVRFW